MSRGNKRAEDEMRAEYDIRGGVRGKYYERYRKGTAGAQSFRIHLTLGHAGRRLKGNNHSKGRAQAFACNGTQAPDAAT
jgi:hypothetical protein